MKLTIYTDDALNEVKKVVEADTLKVPYRVAIYIIESLDSVDLNSENDILKFITSNISKLDKIIKATFGVTDSELECVDVSELISLLVELYKWGLNKVTGIKGTDSKNVMGTV